MHPTLREAIARAKQDRLSLDNTCFRRVQGSWVVVRVSLPPVVKPLQVLRLR